MRARAGFALGCRRVVVMLRRLNCVVIFFFFVTVNAVGEAGMG